MDVAFCVANISPLTAFSAMSGIGKDFRSTVTLVVVTLSVVANSVARSISNHSPFTVFSTEHAGIIRRLLLTVTIIIITRRSIAHRITCQISKPSFRTFTDWAIAEILSTCINIAFSLADSVS